MFGFIVSDGVSVLRAPLKPDRIIVHHVSDLLVLRHFKNTFEVAPDGHLVSLVRGSLRPESDPVLLLTNADHGTTNLTGLAKLLPNHGK